MRFVLFCSLCSSVCAFGTPHIRHRTIPVKQMLLPVNEKYHAAQSPTLLRSFPDAQNSMILAETAEWRQYVPLVVSLAVILDILLGSPLANMALGPMRRAAGESFEDSDDSSGFVKNPKERVDCDAVAQAAVEKARFSMELRQFLEENKTDDQRYEEMRKKIDRQADMLEKNLDKNFG